MTAPGFRFSTDGSEIDRQRVHGWLSTSAYWALGSTRETQERAMDSSLNYAMFDETTGEQVAYARVITDRATFAWLCDVFVIDEVRWRGVGVALIDGVCRELDPYGLRRTLLATADAHGLYARFDFEPLAQPERWMARLAPTAD